MTHRCIFESNNMINILTSENKVLLSGIIVGIVLSKILKEKLFFITAYGITKAKWFCPLYQEKNHLNWGGPCKYQDHPAGGRKEPCYPESSHSVSVIIGAMGLQQKRLMFPLAASWLIGKLLEAFLIWPPGWIGISCWLYQIAKPVYPSVPTFVSPQCQQLNWTFWR